MRRAIAFGAVLLIAVAADLGGLLAPVDDAYGDLRFRLADRTASGEIVVVRIDPESLDRIGVWPWPRSFHAALVDRLAEAGAERIVLDIDFSSASTPAEDGALRDALARADGRVYLPVHRQHAGPASVGPVVVTRPLALFADVAAPVSATAVPDPDGRLRRMALTRQKGDTLLPTIAGVLAGAETTDPRPDGRPGGSFLVDYAFDPATVPQVSAIDVLTGAADPALFAGRRVIIGATAVELGDQHAVPVWRSLPGVLIPVLAAESVLAGRAVTPLPHTVCLAFPLIGVVAMGWLSAAGRWRAAVAVAAGAVPVACVLGHLLYAVGALMLDIAAFQLAAVLAALTALVLHAADQRGDLLRQAALLERQRQLTARVVDSLFDALLTVDGDGRILSANDAARRLLDRSDHGLEGRAIAGLLDPSVGGGVAPRPRAAPGQWSPPLDTVFEHRLRGAEGGPIHAECAVTAFDDGDRHIFVVQIRDVTERRAQAAAVAAAEQRLRTAVESLSEGFVLFDAEDRLVMWNRPFAKLFGPLLGEGVAREGEPFEGMLRRTVDAGLYGEAIGDAEAWIADRLARHRNPPGRSETLLADGRWIGVTEAPTPDGGVVGLYTDLTERKSREAELETARWVAEVANRAKSQFIAAMSHELRTPLNAVIGFAEMMRMEMLGPLGNDTYRGYAADIGDSATHLLGIINDILDLSRIEAGRIDLHEEEVRLADLAAATVRLIARQAGEAGIDLAVAVPADLPPVRVDGRLVKQILSNLLSNAIRFTPAGGRVALSAGRAPDGGLRISVEDTGIGIAEADLERIQRPFEQVSTGDTRQYGGIGLGLPLVRAFTDCHGGRFTLASRPGAGTTATVDLPADRVLPPAATGDAAGAADATSRLRATGGSG